MRLTEKAVRSFRTRVWGHYREHGRKLPWRATTDPYRIFVSEVMLQQTQVSRVREKYDSFIRKFPSFRALGSAPLSDVLRAWQGLGYNRRALNLHRASQVIELEHGGELPCATLEQLPGIGPYTAAAIRAFAFNMPVVFIETNIRTVYIHHFFGSKDKIPDDELLPLVGQTLDRSDPRGWYNALMDYGVWLKQQHGNLSRQSSHYNKQSRFSGSDRQLRGAIVRQLLGKTMSGRSLSERLGNDPRIARIIDDLIAEGFIRRTGRKLTVK